MVCLGNICRSPLAHGIMEHLSVQEGLNWEIDSAGTSGWHNGEQPDRRSIEVAKQNGIEISNQQSRQIKAPDFDYYDYIFAMDQSNLKDILSICPKDKEHKVHLFLPFGNVVSRHEVPDPYYTGGFDYVYDLIYGCCKNIAEKIR